MPRPRYQLAEADVPVVHRWVQAKVRETARAAWDQFPHEHPSATPLHTIDAQDKRQMRRLHPDIVFDWKKIARQLAEKREVCRQYRSGWRTQRRPDLPREPFYGVVDPLARTVYV